MVARSDDIAVAEAAAIVRTVIAAVITGKDPSIGDRISAV